MFSIYYNALNDRPVIGDRFYHGKIFVEVLGIKEPMFYEVDTCAYYKLKVKKVAHEEQSKMQTMQ